MINKQKQIQLNDFNNKEQKILCLHQLPDKILPNILKLLGSSNKKQQNKYKPKYSIFYLSPISNLNLFYNIFFIIVFYVIQLQISFQITFGQSFLSNQFTQFAYNFIYWLIIAIFIFDILLNFNKGYYAFGKGKIVDDHNKIIKHYLNYQFYIDIVNILILIIPQIVNEFGINFIQLIPMILLWIKKYKYQNQITDILQYNRTVRIIFMLIVLFIDILMVGHYGACIFVAIDINLWNSQYYGNNTAYYWLSNNSSYSENLIGGLWYFQYIYAQSFSTGTLSTLAPGPFGKNPIEIVYAIIVMIIFMLLASYVGQVLISILYTEQQKRIFHEQNILNFDKYMVLKQIPDALKTRIYNFFQLIWEVESKMQTQQQKAIINLLPQSLKQQLLFQMSFVNNLYFIKFFQNIKFIQKQLALKINRFIFDSNSIIFKQANLASKDKLNTDQNTQYIYYLAQGMVKYYVQMNKYQQNTAQINFENRTYYKFLKRLKQQKKQQFIISLSNIGKYLGLYEFVTNLSFENSCKTIDLCQIDRISRQDFLNVINLSGFDNLEIFHKLKYQIMIENKLNILNKLCSICMNQHLDHLCPQINIHNKIFDELKYSQTPFSSRQNRNRNFDRNQILGRSKCQSKKINNGKVPLYRKKAKLNKKRSLISGLEGLNSLLNQIMIQNIMSLPEIVLNMSKIDNFQNAYSWKKYYPEFNILELIKQKQQ